MKNKRILITGGAGFIGSTLVGKFVDENEVFIYDNFERDSISKKSYYNHKNLKIIKGDILDSNEINKKLPDVDVIIHAAAIAGIDNVINHPTKTLKVNLLGTINMLDYAARMNKLERFVFISTSEVFGNQAFKVNETQSSSIGPVGEARWTYAISKLSGEHFVDSYRREHEMKTVILRPFNIYGPDQIGEGALKIFIESAINDNDIYIHGDGSQIRAWCYVDDFIEALELTLNNDIAIGESFNIGNARTATTILSLAETTIRVLNSKSKIKFIPKTYPDIELRIPDVSKAFDLLGFYAKTNMDEGIILTSKNAQIKRVFKSE